MEKRCATCGERYPETARYCDQDGEELSVAGPEKRPVRRFSWAFVAGGSLGLLLVGISLPFLLERYLTLRIDVVLEDVRFPGSGLVQRVPGDGPLDLFGQLLDLTDRVLGPKELALKVRVDNRALVPVAIQSARYVVTVSGEQVADGVWLAEGGPRAFKPGSDLELGLTVVPSARGAAAITSELVNGRTPAVGISGELSIAVLGGVFQVPFEVERVEIEPEAIPLPDPRPPAPESTLYGEVA